MNEDMSQYLGVFLDEANEQMQLLEEAILKLEHSPSPALLQEIFRAAHTLKGSSRAMGFVSMGELTHAMEDVFDQLRQNKLTVNRPLIDALFAGLDSLKAMMEDISQAGSTERDTARETSRLRAVLESQTSDSLTTDRKTKQSTTKQNNTRQTTELAVDKPGERETGTSAAPLDAELLEVEAAPPPASAATHKFIQTCAAMLSPSARVAIQEALATGCSIYGLQIEVAPECIMKSVRALMTLQALESVSSTLASSPNEDGLENEDFDTTFDIVLASEATPEAIVAAVQSVNEVRCALILPWDINAPEPYPLSETVTDSTRALENAARAKITDKTECELQLAEYQADSRQNNKAGVTSVPGASYSEPGIVPTAKGGASEVTKTHSASVDPARVEAHKAKSSKCDSAR